MSRHTSVCLDIPKQCLDILKKCLNRTYEANFLLYSRNTSVFKSRGCKSCYLGFIVLVFIFGLSSYRAFQWHIKFFWGTTRNAWFYRQKYWRFCKLPRHLAAIRHNCCLFWLLWCNSQSLYDLFGFKILKSLVFSPISKLGKFWRTL